MISCAVCTGSRANCGIQARTIEHWNEGPEPHHKHHHHHHHHHRRDDEAECAVPSEVFPANGTTHSITILIRNQSRRRGNRIQERTRKCMETDIGMNYNQGFSVVKGCKSLNYNPSFSAAKGESRHLSGGGIID
eukprot:3326390-Amphidinium_carterae.1